MTSEIWYQTASRWGQTNLVEIDPERYDVEWWKEHWRRTSIHGVIVNAGGIVAYYPSEFPLHNRAVGLGSTNLLETVVDAAREVGLAVIARMDSNRVTEEFYRVHPDWICVDKHGNPLMAGPKYVTCINSPYYSEYLPAVMGEIIEQVQPDGFADNSWAGLPRDAICYCRHCDEQFRDFAGIDLPGESNWENPGYGKWIEWNYRRRTELWDFNNEVTTRVGGEHCRWMGMVAADLEKTPMRFIDLRDIIGRTPFVMLDHQSRFMSGSFDENTNVGKRVHELATGHVLAPESMAQYSLSSPVFRQASMPEAEMRLWATSGFAGGIQPWWHHIGALHEDRRQYTYAEPLFTWHEKNQDVLLHRRPVADVAVVWSQHSIDHYGRDDAKNLAVLPHKGVVKALDRAGITALPIHADDVATEAHRFTVLVLANVAILTADQVEAIEAFAAGGGSVIATSETGLYEPYGGQKADFDLSDLFGVHRGDGEYGGRGVPITDIEQYARHSYLRLLPEIRSGVYGPTDTRAPEPHGERHAVLDGFELTDSIPFGGYLPAVRVDDDVTVLATYVPEYPIYPPETSFTRTFAADIPAITVRENASGAKLVWLGADIDRCFGREDQNDHATVIANAVTWAREGEGHVAVHGSYGIVSSTLYEQDTRKILHLNNRLQLSSTPGQNYELLPVGPLTIRLHAPGHAEPDVELRVAEVQVPTKRDGEYLEFIVYKVEDHEVAVIPTA